MPGFDGTGPSGRGPMSGQGRGFCVLRSSEKSPHQLQGFAGLQSFPVDQIDENFEKNRKEVISMPFGDGKGPAGSGPMTVRSTGFYAGYPVPVYMNPVMARFGYYRPGIHIFGPYRAGLYGYGAPYPVPYAGWVNSWLRRGFGIGRGWGRGRGKFGCW